MELDRIIWDLKENLFRDGDMEVDYSFIEDDKDNLNHSYNKVDTTLGLIIEQLDEYSEINGSIDFLVWIGENKLTLMVETEDYENE